MPLVFGAQGVQPTLRGQPSNVYLIQAGEVKLIPAGSWYVGLGPYTAYQVFDPITGIWRRVGDVGKIARVDSDGVNHRIANQTGCAVGALITNGGTGYTSPPTVTSPAAGSWQAIIGGAVNTSVTVTNGGTNYVYPPEIDFAAPPSPGIQATGYATISGGALTAITVTNQGAGYAGGAPVISVVNDPRDSTGSGATASAVLTGAGTMTGLLATDHGNPQTSVPALTISGGGGTGAAATAIMDWSITNLAFSGGTGYTVGVGAFELSFIPQITSGVAAYTNPATDTRLVRMRQALIYVPTTATGAPTATGLVVIDGGHYQNVPQWVVIQNSGLYPSPTTVTVSMGGINDFVTMFPV